MGLSGIALMVGIALVLTGYFMPAGQGVRRVMRLVGWLLVISTTLLAVVPGLMLEGTAT
ncbi:MAG: hypothetical protein AAGH41_15105 [Pseudomonadota bacterium]